MSDKTISPDKEQLAQLQAELERLQTALREALYWIEEHAPGRAHESLQRALSKPS